MRIGIEAQRVFRKNKHGMDYVVLEEIKRLQNMDHNNEYYIFVKPGDDVCLKDTDNFHIITLKCPSYPLWEQIALPLAARKLKLDILHCTSNTAPIFCPTPLVLTLHDIIFLEKRTQTNLSLYQNMGWYYRKWVVPMILNKCSRIITVSDFERNNILNKLNIQADKLKMIYNGVNDWFTPEAINDTAYTQYIDEPGYFFFLGNTDPKKNTEGTLIAYSNYLKESTVKRPLLVADLDRDRANKIIAQHHLDNIADHIILPGYINNAHLPSIYAHAYTFIYTSYRESFGIPLLEAMASGTPVITSNTSSMPEIAAKAALFSNPHDPKTITEAMIRIEREKTLHQTLSEAGKQRAQHFSWTNTAQQLLQLYESI